MKSIWRAIERANEWHDNIMHRTGRYGLDLLWVLFVGACLFSLIILVPNIAPDAFGYKILATAGVVVFGVIVISRILYVCSVGMRSIRSQNREGRQ